MPRAEAAATDSSTLPGVYRWLLDAERRYHDRADPRLTLQPDLDPVALAGADTRAAAQPPSGMLLGLLRGRPVLIPAWRLRGATYRAKTASWPWLLDCDWVEVHSDDTVVPAEAGVS
jgi:hypothetical protein